MATITTVEVNYNRKVQLEQFEPVQHGVTLMAELSEGDDPEEVYDELSDQAEDMAERALGKRIAQTKLAESDD